MKNAIIMLLILLSGQSFAQELLWDVDDVLAPDVIEPKYDNGDLKNFYDFVNQTFDLSKVTKAGQIVVTFTINTLGEMKNIRVIKAPNPEAALEMFAVFRKAKKWEPAKKGGVATSIKMKMPFGFTMKKSTTDKKY